MTIDSAFLLAVGALGWGLSLATYRPLAQVCGWPLGSAQASVPALTALVGMLSSAVGIVFALHLGLMTGGVALILLGLALATFWSGFLRVGAQSALLLAPIAAVALLCVCLAASIG